MAAASATAPSTIRNVGAVSCTAMPSCVSAEDRVNHYGDLGYGAEHVDARGAAHKAGHELRQEPRENEDQDGRYDVGDVCDELAKDLRDLPYAQRVGRHRDGDDKDEPEHELA